MGRLDASATAWLTLAVQLGFVAGTLIRPGSPLRNGARRSALCRHRVDDSDLHRIPDHHDLDPSCPRARRSRGLAYAFATLAIGPILGILAMIRLQRVISGASRPAPA